MVEATQRNFDLSDLGRFRHLCMFLECSMLRQQVGIAYLTSNKIHHFGFVLDLIIASQQN